MTVYKSDNKYNVFFNFIFVFLVYTIFYFLFSELNLSNLRWTTKNSINYLVFIIYCSYFILLVISVFILRLFRIIDIDVLNLSLSVFVFYLVLNTTYLINISNPTFLLSVRFFISSFSSLVSFIISTKLINLIIRLNPLSYNNILIEEKKEDEKLKKELEDYKKMRFSSDEKEYVEVEE
jgi:signal transduction histidine kinase